MLRLLYLLFPACLTTLEAQEIVGVEAPGSAWTCTTEGCDDVTVWVQVEPEPDVSVVSPATITLYYFQLFNEAGDRLFDMSGNSARTAWIREVAPVGNDCNLNPQPCLFDKNVQASVSKVSFKVPAGGFYGAVFPCNRRTECRTELPSGEPIQGVVVWTAPVGWRVRVGADFWVDREAKILGTNHVGPWISGKGVGTMVGYNLPGTVR